MAATDAKPVPIKNAAYRITFPIYDADGDLVTGATGLDSEVSKDGGTFADCTNEATEIATSSGMYYLDLTSTEMNADTVAIIVKTSTSGAKTTVVVLNPQEAGDVKVDVESISGDTAAADNLEAAADGTGYNLGGGSIVAASVTATVNANAIQISGDTTAADNAEAFFDGTGYAGTNNVIPTVTTLTNAPSDSSGTTTLLSLVTSTRAGYLDNLSGGAVALQSTLLTVSGYLNTEVAAILEDTGTTIPSQIAALSIPSASTNASAVRTELATELGRIDVATSTRLAPTTAGRTLDVSAGGEAGIDWANIGSPTTTVNLSGTTVKTATDVETDTADIQSKIGTPVDLGGGFPTTLAGMSSHLNSVIDTVATITDSVGLNGSGLSVIPWNAAWDAEVQSECTDALNAYDPPTNTEMEARTLAAASYATASTLATVADNVVLILADTGTDGVVLSSGQCNAIADHVLRRNQSNVEASSNGDTLALSSVYGAVQQMQEASASGTTLTVKKTDGSTTLGTKTLATDAAADPVTGVS